MNTSNKLIKQYYQLNGKTVTRKELSTFHIALFDALPEENQQLVEIWHKIGNVLFENPKARVFNLTVSGTTTEMLNGVPFIPYNEAEEIEQLGKAVTPNDIYTMITNKVLDLIKSKKELFWRKAWRQQYNGLAATNFVSKKAYRGINAFMLNVIAPLVREEKKLETLPYWLTFKQIGEKKGKLTKGSEGMEVVYFTLLYGVKQESPKIDFATYNELKYKNFVKKNKSKLNGTAKYYKIPILKYYKVFNAADITGIKFPEFKKEDQPTEPERIEAAEKIVKHYPTPPKLNLESTGDRAFYRPMLDDVTMPKLRFFDGAQKYYGTFFHELIHSTGHAKRLKRDFSGKFGTPNYAAEELVAELGALFLCAEAGIMYHTLHNSAAYIKGWQKRLVDKMKKDNKFFFRASSKAQAGADHILNRDTNGTPKYLKDKSKTVVKKTEKPITKLYKALKLQAVKELEENNIKRDKKIPNYKLGDKYKSNFDYWGLMKYILNLNSDTSLNVLTKLYNSATDVNYHTVAKKIDNIIVFLKKKIKPTNKKPITNKKTKTKQLALFGALNGVSSISSEHFKNMTVWQLRKFTINYFKQELKGKKVAIKNSLKEVVFTNTAGRKIAQGGAMYKEKAALINSLETLIKNSTYNNFGSPKRSDKKDILGYLNFKSKVIVDGVKRHVRISIVLYKNRKTLLKNYDLGNKKNDTISKGSKNKLPLNDEIVSLSKNKITKTKPNNQKDELKAAQTPIIIKVDAEQGTSKHKGANDVPAPQIKGLKSVNNRSNNVAHEYYKITGDVAKLLGKVEIKPKQSVAVTLDAPQGAGKTRAFFQFINEFASKGYKVLFVSAEEHPESSLFMDKLDQYIAPANQHNVFAIDSTNYNEISDLIPQFDIIFIDSWNKILYNNKGIDFDHDLRKKFDSKLFFAIFQRTQNGQMRGGSNAQFDGDIILKIVKEEDFKDNYVIADKNRYQNGDIHEIKYSIYYKKLIDSSTTEKEPPTTTNEKIIFLV